jgi:hypothetical protein
MYDVPRLEIDADLERRITEHALSNGRSPAEVLRDAVHEYISARMNLQNAGATNGDESVFDRLSRHGLIGCVKGGKDTPRDLSTNPKYLEGFGSD